MQRQITLSDGAKVRPVIYFQRTKIQPHCIPGGIGDSALKHHHPPKKVLLVLSSEEIELDQSSNESQWKNSIAVFPETVESTRRDGRKLRSHDRLCFKQHLTPIPAAVSSLTIER
jgi:hypothetical protein